MPGEGEANARRGGVVMRTRTGAILIVAGLAVLATSAASADATKKNAKFCASLTDFHSGVEALRSLGASSTIAELRTASERVESDAHQVVKTGGKLGTPTAKHFTDSTRQLKVDTRAIPDNLTIAQAQSRIRDDVGNVERAARQLATEAGCPQAATPPAQ
jgi:hypothetical protein